METAIIVFSRVYCLGCKRLHLRLEVWPLNRVLRPFREVLGTLEATYRVESRYIRIPGLSVHTRGPWFNLRLKLKPEAYGYIMQTRLCSS